MDIQHLIDMLTEGLPADQVAVVTAAIQRDSVKAKATTLKQQSEYDALNGRLTAMQQELEGDAASGKLGTRAYAKWYQDNQKDVEGLITAQKKYIEKYGKFEGSFEPPTTTQPVAAALDPATIQRMVDERIQTQYAPRWSGLLESTGNLVQKHMFAGRKTPIDFTAVSKIAQDKYAGNLDQAYDEWDAPERIKVQAADTEKEIKRRVDEEIQKRGVNTNFPGGADFTPSALSARPKTEVDGFDKTALRNNLAKDWMSAGSGSTN